MIEHFYSNNWLDRAAERRLDAEWLAARWAAPGTRVVPVRAGRSLVRVDDPPVPVIAPSGSLPVEAPPERRVFLGVDRDDRAYFAVRLDEGSNDTDSAAESYVDLRRLGSVLEAGDAGLLAYARAVATWHDTHRFCGACGARARSEQAGWLRACTESSCGRQHFPRTDPAIIVRVTHGERILLGRQSSWPARWYSVLAGFVEPGESLEDAVRREVLEETSVRCGEVRYDSSQPWPFPASLMLGFSATATTTRIDVAGDELEDARWFTREEIAANVADGSLKLSPRVSISRHLIDTWLDAAGEGSRSAGGRVSAAANPPGAR